MVQREVADRFFAAPGTKAYGAVSVLVQLVDRAHRLPSGLARGLPAAAERRVCARRVPPRPRRASRRREATSSRRRSRTVARRSPNSLALAGRRARASGRPPRSRRSAASRPPRRGARAARVRRPRRRAPHDDAPAPAKINLALVVGPTRADGLHEVATCSSASTSPTRVSLEPAAELASTGFADDTLVRRALEVVAAAAGSRAALARADREADPGRGRPRRRKLRRRDGARGSRTSCSTEPLAARAAARARRRARRRRPVLPRAGPAARHGRRHRRSSRSTCRRTTPSCSCCRRRSRSRRPPTVYGAFDGARSAGSTSAAALRARAPPWRAPRDLAALPPNDLARSPLRGPLRELGAFRADVSGAGPDRLRRSSRDRRGRGRARAAVLERLGRDLDHGSSVVALIADVHRG